MSLRGHELNTYLFLACQNSEVFKVSIEVWIQIFGNRKWGNVLKLFKYGISLVFFFNFNISNS